jgi:hypothetical protein
VDTLRLEKVQNSCKTAQLKYMEHGNQERVVYRYRWDGLREAEGVGLKTHEL